MTSSRVVAAVFLLLFSAAASAATRNWVGPSAGVWSDPDNWSPAGAPVSGDTLTFPNTILALTNDVDGLSLAGLGGGGAPGSTLDGAPLAVTNYVALSGWVVNVDVTFDGDSPSADGDFGGAFDVSGGTVRFPYNPSAVIRGALTGSGTLAGSVKITHDGTFSGLAQNGFLQIDGASLPSLDVKDAELFGHGTVGAVTTANSLGLVHPSAVLSPDWLSDHTVGTLSLASLSLASRYFADIDASSNVSDQLIVAGDVTLSGPLSLSIDGPSPTVGQSFVLIDHAGVAQVNGYFVYLNDSTGLRLTEGTVFNLGGTYFRITYRGGDGNDVVLDVVEPPEGTSTVVTVSPTSVLSGQNVTFTANVSYLDGSPVEGGTVTFLLGPGRPLAVAAVVDGVATARADVYGSTTYSVTAQYDGNSNALASESAAVSLTVHTVPVTMEAHTSPNPSMAGDAVRLFVTLTDADDPSMSVSGSIEVLSGTAPEGFLPIIARRNGPFSGTVEIDLTGLSSGDYSFGVRYMPNPPFGPASQAVPHTISASSSRRPTTTALTMSNPSITYGGTIPLSAAVAPASPGMPTPTGAVTFLVDGHSIGVVALTNGTASMDTGVLTAGSHSLTASYGGDTNSEVSTSAPSIAIVAKAATSVAFSSPPKVNAGDLVTIRVEILRAGQPEQTATGSVSASDAGRIVAEESVSHGAATLTIVGLTPGSHPLLITYSGDGNLMSSTMIVPEDVALPVIAISNSAVDEGNAGVSPRAVLAVTLSAPSADVVRVVFGTVDGTARADDDYVSIRGVVEFAPGETLQRIEINIIGDRVPEADETFSVILSDSVNATIDVPAAVVTITNDDQVPPRHRPVRH